MFCRWNGSHHHSLCFSLHCQRCKWCTHTGWCCSAGCSWTMNFSPPTSSQHYCGRSQGTFPSSSMSPPAHILPQLNVCYLGKVHRRNLPVCNLDLKKMSITLCLYSIVLLKEDPLWFIRSIGWLVMFGNFLSPLWEIR